MRRLAALGLILFLAACTTPVVKADVTRFHAFDQTFVSGQPSIGGAPTSFTIAPEQGQVGSLEFQDYATRVADALTALGWRPVAPGSGPSDMRVTLNWGSGPPETEFYQSPSAYPGGVGWGYHPGWYGGGLYDPFPYWETRSITTWPLWLSVRMTKGDGAQLPVMFEGRAVAERKNREIAPVIPYLVRALFTDFPGANGKTVRVVVPIQN